MQRSPSQEKQTYIAVCSSPTLSPAAETKLSFSKVEPQKMRSPVREKVSEIVTPHFSAGVKHLAKGASASSPPVTASADHSSAGETHLAKCESVYQLALPPVAEPWDILIENRDVLARSNEVTEIARNSRIRHWGPNCATFTRAREKPIPGVKNPPRPLRSREWPEGLPGLRPHDSERVRKDTVMAKMAAADCQLAHSQGDGFTLEHPGRSLAHELSEWKQLAATPGVFQVFHHHCMFADCRHRKYQVVYTNILEVVDEIGLLCKSEAVCSRTGEPHEPWGHKVQHGRVIAFSTAPLSEYPKELCDAQARAYKHFIERTGYNHKD